MPGTKRVALTAKVAAFLAAAVWGRNAMATEQPKYQVVAKYDAFEVREYAPYLVAETEVEGNRQDAGNAGFRRLAGYIFGKNSGSQEIAMTAPVAQSKAGTKIAMTAPVSEAPAGEGKFVIQFMMPSQYRLEDLPKPLDESIRFRQIPARRVAAIRYSGTWSESRYQEQLEKLRSAMVKEGLEAAGEPVWARYDPPFKPWFLRTNEILIDVRR
ncbi:MAG TPA: heme-binding protein [Myxococcales bacterium]